MCRPEHSIRLERESERERVRVSERERVGGKERGERKRETFLMSF
jgi:hypothetical protein